MSELRKDKAETFEDGETQSVAVASGERTVDEVVRMLLDVQPRYIGVYAPGDFASPLYRLVIPDQKGGKRGRGYRATREEIILESADRRPIEALLARLRELVGADIGPFAMRHIRNPSTSKDEGIRLVWPRSAANEPDAKDVSPSALDEMADWSRRDRLIRAGKTVREADDDVVPYGPFAIPAGYQAQGVEASGAQMVCPWLYGVNPILIAPPLYARVSALRDLSPSDPISPVGPVHCKKLDPPTENDRPDCRGLPRVAR